MASYEQGFDPETDPDWAPSGQDIAFTSHRSGRFSEVHVMESNGEQEQALTDGQNFEASQPAYSPDGHEIAFVLYDPDSSWSLLGSLWTMGADASNPADAINSGPFNGYSYFLEPDWQPVSGATEGTGDLSLSSS